MNNMDDRIVYRACGAYAWLEQGTSIQFKAISPSGDPLDLNGTEVRKIIEMLTSLVEELDKLDEYEYPQNS